MSRPLWREANAPGATANGDVKDPEVDRSPEPEATQGPTPNQGANDLSATPAPANNPVPDATN